ncbi:MAG: hypothetical protein HOM96_01625 [Rickettsiales bacterium]|jgi:DNA polymerase III subunit chi|nr:hypothetical protein [Rickettsiales bacterium]
MNSYSFYQISKSPLDKILPSLLYKIYAQLKKPMMLLVEDSDVTKYDALFWTFSTNKFLPHGTEANDSDYYKYLLITSKSQNINKSEILIAKDEVSEEFAQNFKKIIYLFDDNHPNLAKFKDKYQQEKQNKPKNTLFWQQDEKGKWANK